MRAMTTRTNVTRLAAGLSGLAALFYLLIGLNAVTIENDITESEQQAFGFTAAAVFGVAAVVATLLDRRWLWAVGAVGLGLIIMMYFNIAPERDPQFELWGVLIRIVQLPLLGSLIYLAVTKRSADLVEPSSHGEDDHRELEGLVQTPSPPPPPLL